MRFILALCFCLLCNLSLAKQVNIYVGYDDVQLQQKIKHFNQFLDEHGIFDKYDVRPFLEKHPLHTTLYLTEYKPEQITKVMSALQTLAQDWTQFDVTTAAIYMTKGNYLMMDVEHNPKADGMNPVMQEYSDQAVMHLYKMRDATAPIPDWAKQIPSKFAAFRRYGSPNVFFELSPHFTLLAKQFQDPTTEAAFQADIDALLKQYEQQYPNQPITLRATHIGMGYVNNFGQVTDELARFALK